MNAIKGFYTFLKVIAALSSILFLVIALFLTTDAKQLQYDYDEPKSSIYGTDVVYEITPRFKYSGDVFGFENTEIKIEIRRDSEDGELLASDSKVINLEPNTEWSDTFFLAIDGFIFYNDSIKKYLVVSVEGDFSLISRTFISFKAQYADEL